MVYFDVGPFFLSFFSHAITSMRLHVSFARYFSWISMRDHCFALYPSMLCSQFSKRNCLVYFEVGHFFFLSFFPMIFNSINVHAIVFGVYSSILCLHFSRRECLFSFKAGPLSLSYERKFTFFFSCFFNRNSINMHIKPFLIKAFILCLYFSKRECLFL